MSALPRPDVAPGPTRSLNDALHDLHHRAGWPSLRALARRTGVSHTTVSKMFSAPALPPWGMLELLVEAMDGDTAHFHQLWLEASTPDGSRPRVPDSPIAGRRAELVVVRRHLEAGTGLLLVTGEAGIGKTTLVEAAATTTGVLVATGHCLPLSVEEPLGPVAEVLRSRVVSGHLARALEDLPSYVRDTLAPMMPEIEGTIGHVPSDDWTRQRLFAAVTAALEAVGDRTPLALVMEDLHWADLSTLDLLEHLLTGGSSVRVVATWRLQDRDVGEVQASWLVRARRHPRTSEVQIGNLDRDGTTDQLRSLLGTDVPTARIDEIYARTLGQPLFTAHMAAGHDTDALPKVLEDLLDARLAPLSGDEWTIARALGVADRPLRADALAAVTGLGLPDLTRGLRALAERHLLAHEGDEAWLNHPLIADGVRRRLVPGEAWEVHVRLGDTLSALADTSAAEVAGHYRAAQETGRELPWRVRAAEDAQRRAAYRQAADHWHRALAIWEDSPGPDVTISRGDAVLAAVDALTGAGDDLGALELAESSYLGDHSMTSDVRLVLGMRVAGIVWGQEGPERALEVLERAMTAHGTDIAPDPLARCLRLRASLLAKSGRNDEALAVVQTAMAQLDRLTDPDVAVRLMSSHGWHLATAGDLEAARASFAEARRRMPEDLRPSLEPHVAMMCTDALLHHARPPEEVEEAARDALRRIDELDLRSTIANMVRSNVAQAWLSDGRPRRAAEALPEHGWGDDAFAAWPLRIVAGRIALARGDVETALDLLTGPHQNDAYARLELAPHVAESMCWAGRAEEAAVMLEDLIVRGLPGDTVAIAGRVFMMLARVSAEAVDPGERARGLRGLRSTAAVDPLGPADLAGERSACTAQWEAELARGEARDTAELWSRATVEWDRLPRRHDAAYSRWRAAQCALREGRGTLAATLLKRATADARDHVPLSRAIAETAGGR